MSLDQVRQRAGAPRSALFFFFDAPACERVERHVLSALLAKRRLLEAHFVATCPHEQPGASRLTVEVLTTAVTVVAGCGLRQRGRHVRRIELVNDCFRLRHVARDLLSVTLAPGNASGA
jgi:hypothetical protein